MCFFSTVPGVCGCDMDRGGRVELDVTVRDVSAQQGRDDHLSRLAQPNLRFNPQTHLGRHLCLGRVRLYDRLGR